MNTTKQLEITEETYESFTDLKKSIEDIVGEEVTDSEIIDFMIRSLLGNEQLEEDEEDQHNHHWCCGKGHHDHN